MEGGDAGNKKEGCQGGRKDGRMENKPETTNIERKAEGRKKL